MAANLKKAGSVIRNSFRAKRYALFDAKENNYLLTPEKPKRPESNSSTPKIRPRNVSLASSSDENENFPGLANPSASVSKQSQPKLKRSTSMTQSVRIAVGTIRQKLKLSTRRGQLRTTPKRAGARQSAAKSHEVHLYSPFKIDTPKGVSRRHIETCHTLETPTRLRREVEALTINMQALSALTPNTLHDRARTRSSQLSANGRLRSPRSTCKRIVL